MVVNSVKILIILLFLSIYMRGEKVKNSKNSKQSKDETKVNSVPNLVFRPFRSCKLIVVVLCFLSMAICMWLFWHVVFIRDILFAAEELREIANLALNIVLVVGALGLTIFLLPIGSKQDQNEKLLIRYVGNTLVLASVTVLGYIISYCDSLIPQIVFGVYSIAMLISLCSCLIRTISTMVAYFNIRD